MQIHWWNLDPWIKSEPEVAKQIYQEKFRITELIKAKSVIELGVRAGYSATCFLESGCENYIGLDATDSYGGTKGAVDWAKNMLPGRYPNAKIAIHNVDTQKIDTLKEYGKAECVNIDANHSLNGCLHDLEIALTAEPKWIMCDDMFHHPDEVAVAAYAFVGKYCFQHILIDTLRGDMLIRTR